jgi:hypothetical protein
MAFEPANIPLTLWVGNTKEYTLAFKYCDAGISAPLPLTGKTVYVTIFHNGVVVLQKSTIASTVSIHGDYNEEITTTITPNDTRLLAACEYIESLNHEVEIRSGSLQQTWVYGRVILKGGSNADA